MNLAVLATLLLWMRGIFSLQNLGFRAANSIGRSSLRMYSRDAADISSKHVLVAVATGTEEMEAIIAADCLVRAGAKVCIASTESSLTVVCSRGVKITADALIAEVSTLPFDLIIIPGGMPGATNLRASTALCNMLRRQNSESKPVAAICAAPAVVLGSLGILDGKTATCYPAAKFISTLPSHVSDRVYVDGNVITSQGPGTSFAFAIKLIEVLFGEEKAQAVAKELLLA